VTNASLGVAACRNELAGSAPTVAAAASAGPNAPSSAWPTGSTRLSHAPASAITASAGYNRQRGKQLRLRGTRTGSTHAATTPRDATGRVAPLAATPSTGAGKSARGGCVRWPSATPAPRPPETESGQHPSEASAAAVGKARSRARSTGAAGGRAGAYVGRWAAGLTVVAAGGGGSDRRRLSGGGDSRGARALE